MKWIVALVGFAALGIAGINFDAFSVLSGGSGIQTIEQTLHSQAQSALNTANIKWAKVRMKGQKAVISGAAPDQNALNAAREAVYGSMGKGGMLMGGITAVQTDQIRISKPEQPSTWQAQKQADHQWLLSGAVATKITRLSLLDNLSDVGAKITEDMNVTDDVDEQWDRRARTLLDALKRLDTGRASMQGNIVALQGSTTSAQVKTDLEQVFASFAPPITGTTSIVLNTPANEEESEAPSSQTNEANNASDIKDAQDCQALFNQALSENTIHFATSKANIEPDSFALLDSLAALAGRCAEFQMTITGHTDHLGDPDFNNWLSEQRAQAVMTYLTGKGIAHTSIKARGAGSKEPVCQNNTASCRRLNRRIEISVE